ncbi:MAG: serine/threonine-protein kinase [Polyangiaceae bacterium]
MPRAGAPTTGSGATAVSQKRIRVDPIAFGRLSSRSNTWFLLCVTPGALFLPFPAVVFLYGIIDGIKSSLRGEDSAGALLTALIMAFPVTFSVALLLIAWSIRRRLKDIERIATEYRARPSSTDEEVARTSELSPKRFRQLSLQAAAAGVLVEEALPQVPVIVHDSGIRETGAAAMYTQNPRMPSSSHLSSNYRSAPVHAATPVSAGRLSAPPPSVAPASLPPGAILCGRYELESVLGEGGMGRIYQAKHTRTGRRYALKMMLPDGVLSLDAKERFRREATLVSSLEHPSIVKVHDFDVAENGVPFLVMDLLNGETLDERIKRLGPMPFPIARNVIVAIAHAVQAAHDQGLVHRDIKPENIMLARLGDGSERPIMLDFGVVRKVYDPHNKLTETGAMVGTPSYMSPEQALGRATDARSDVYALATVLFELLTGQPPFSDPLPTRILSRLLSELPPPISGRAAHPVPFALESVMSTALSKAPETRYPSMTAFSDALLRVQ